MKTRAAWLLIAALAGTARADLATEVAHARHLRFRADVPVVELDAQAFAAREGSGADVWGVPSGDVDAFFDGVQVVARTGASDLAIAAALDRALVEQAIAARGSGSAGSAGSASDDGDAENARALLEAGDAEALVIELALARAGKPPPWNDPDVVTQLVGDRAELAYVVGLLQRRGWRAVDAVLEKPPRTTSQILHPSEHIEPIAIAGAAPAGWTLAEDRVRGELGVRALLEAHGFAEPAAAEAAEDWRGDRALACTRGPRAMGVWRSEWASEADATRAREAIARALDDAVPGVEVDDSPDATRWLALDGSYALVERRGTGVLAAIGVPLYETSDLWSLFTRTDSAPAR